jgi:hypothetical protein
MQPNAFLAAAVDYLFGHGQGGAETQAWEDGRVERNDRPRRGGARKAAFRDACRFKWFVRGLLDARSVSAERRARSELPAQRRNRLDDGQDGVILGLCAPKSLQ